MFHNLIEKEMKKQTSSRERRAVGSGTNILESKSLRFSLNHLEREKDEIEEYVGHV